MQNALDDFHSDSLFAEAGISDLQADRRALLDGAMDATLGDLIEAGHALEFRRFDLEVELVRLHWQRHKLLPTLLPDFIRAVATATTENEQAIETEFERFVAAGALDAMPAGQSPNGRHQLRHRVLQELPCLASKGKLERFRSALDALQESTQRPPHASYCTIKWESGGSLAEQVLGLAQQ